MDNYTIWTKHNKPWVLMEDNEEYENIADWLTYMKRVPLEMNH